MVWYVLNKNCEAADLPQPVWSPAHPLAKETMPFDLSKVSLSSSDAVLMTELTRYRWRLCESAVVLERYG